MNSAFFPGDRRPDDPFGDPLDAILAEIAINLQLPPGLHEKAVGRYGSVCRHIDRPGSPLEGRVSCLSGCAHLANRCIRFDSAWWGNTH